MFFKIESRSLFLSAGSRGWQARLLEKWRIIIGYNIREMASGDRGRVEKSVTFLLSRISRKNGA